MNGFNKLSLYALVVVGIWAIAAAAIPSPAQGAMANGPYDLVVSALNPVVRYQCDEAIGATALNSGSAGAGNNGTYTSVTLAQPSAFAQLATAGSYGGTTTYLSMPDHSAFETTNMSIQFWFKRSSTITGRRDMFTNKLNDSHDFGIFSDSPAANTVTIFKSFNTGGTAVNFTGIADDVWHDFVLSMAGTSWTLYVDGAQKGTLGGTNEYTLDGSWAGVTKRLATSGNSPFTGCFPGLMDEFALYPTALTAGQVAALHTAAQQAVSEPGDIPEPATLALLGLAATGLGGYLRRRRAA